MSWRDSHVVMHCVIVSSNGVLLYFCLLLLGKLLSSLLILIIHRIGSLLPNEWLFWNVLLFHRNWKFLGHKHATVLSNFPWIDITATQNLKQSINLITITWKHIAGVILCKSSITHNQIWENNLAAKSQFIHYQLLSITIRKTKERFCHFNLNWVQF